MPENKLSRRSFFRFAGLAGGSALLTACAPQVVTEVVTQVVTQIVTAPPPTQPPPTATLVPAASIDLPIDELIDTYLAAWSEPNAAERRRLLEQVWEEQGTYTDPTAHVPDRAALDVTIGQFLAAYPGAVLTVVGQPEHYLEHVLFGWVITFADGTELPGRDYGQLSPAGRLQKIVGFF